MKRMGNLHNQALILVDMQVGFLEPCWGERNNPALEKNVENLLGVFRSKMWTVAHARLDGEFGEVSDTARLVGSVTVD